MNNIYGISKPSSTAQPQTKSYCMKYNIFCELATSSGYCICTVCRKQHKGKTYIINLIKGLDEETQDWKIIEEGNIYEW